MTLLSLAFAAVVQSSAQAECQQFFTKHKMVGMSAAIVRDGKVLYHGEFGFANKEKNAPIKQDTLIRLASVSKPITAVGVMKLVEQGKLSLTQDVRAEIGLGSGPKITLAQLLSHTAGIRHYRDDKDPTGEVFDYFKSAKDASKMFIADAVKGPPGVGYSYSTHAYTLVAILLEKAAKASYPAYMRKNIFSFAKGGLDAEVSVEKSKPNRSEVYGMGDAGPERYPRREDNSWKFAGGGLEASATGLGLWGSALLQGKIVNEASRKAMWTPTGAPGGGATYGLGWGVAGDLVSHNGAQQGSRTAFYLNRKTGTVVVVLTNTSGSFPLDALCKKLMESY